MDKELRSVIRLEMDRSEERTDRAMAVRIAVQDFDGVFEEDYLRFSTSVQQREHCTVTLAQFRPAHYSQLYLGRGAFGIVYHSILSAIVANGVSCRFENQYAGRYEANVKSPCLLPACGRF